MKTKIYCSFSLSVLHKHLLCPEQTFRTNIPKWITSPPSISQSHVPDDAQDRNKRPQPDEPEGEIEGLQVLTTENNSIKEKMRDDFKKLISKDHQELMRVKDGKTRATFYVKQKGDLISEMIMLADTDNSFNVIQLLGNFTLQDIQEITKEMNK